MPLDMIEPHQNPPSSPAPSTGRAAEILTPEALDFLAEPAPQVRRPPPRSARRAAGPAKALRRRRDAGLPGRNRRRPFQATGPSRPIPADLMDRRVEITGPTDRKMIINALNSGAKVFMADFEDATSPTWTNLIEGQINLKDRWAGAIDFTDPKTGKAYALKADPAVLMVRPRGWHLPERHVTVDGEAMSGSLFDFGLYVFHNAKTAAGRRVRRLFLPAEDGERTSRRGSGTTRLRPRRGQSSGLCRRHAEGHGADRDPARGLRDGRDHSTNCATTWPASTAAAGTTSSPTSSGSAATLTL